MYFGGSVLGKASKIAKEISPTPAVKVQGQEIKGQGYSVTLRLQKKSQNHQ